MSSGGKYEYLRINLFTVAIIGMLTSASFRGKSSLFSYFELEDSKLVLENALASIQKEIEALEKEIEKINHSQSYAKKVLRDKYHILEEDESIIFFAD